MDLLTFLNTLQETLNQVEVKGEKNFNLMLGSLRAINNMRNSILSPINAEKPDVEAEKSQKEQEQQKEKGDEMNG